MRGGRRSAANSARRDGHAEGRSGPGTALRNWLCGGYTTGPGCSAHWAIADPFVDLMEGGVVAPADSGPESLGRLDVLAELAGDVEGVARRLRDLAEG